MHLYNCLTSSALLCHILAVAMTPELITAIACDSIGHAVAYFRSVPGVALCSGLFQIHGQSHFLLKLCQDAQKPTEPNTSVARRIKLVLKVKGPLGT